MDTVVIVGGGGREHAIAWSLARSPRVDRVLVAPGNAGTAVEAKCENVDVASGDLDGIVALALAEDTTLVIVGPEAPLVAGLVDALAEAGVVAFGPTADAARLEGSKVHSKQFLIGHGIPTGAAEMFTDVDDALAHLASLESVPVVKADGLAAGKGVIVPDTMDAAADAVREMLVDGRFGSAGDAILLEERLIGPEVSILAFCDGTDFRVMPAAQDHKRLLAGNRGPNTGGMGAFVPSPIADPGVIDRISKEVLEPTITALAAEGRPYRGVLYAGMMLTADGPKVIEFNCRFGDPECQVVLPLLRSDLLDVLEACATGSLADVDIVWSRDAAVTVVMATEGYPASSAAPVAVAGLDAATSLGCTVFHASTSLVDGMPHTAGGRVLAVSALSEELSMAAEKAHAGVAAISFAGAQHRADIARASAGHRP